MILRRELNELLSIHTFLQVENTVKEISKKVPKNLL